MQGVSRSFDEQSPPYATGEEVCGIFQRDMHHLYALSFLLTANHVLAEKCFVQSLDDLPEGDPVFGEGAQSRVSWTIARNAIQISRPRPGDNLKERPYADDTGLDHPAEFAAVVGLPGFERFVFVLSLLERYTDQESSHLLNCSVDDVVKARAKALQSIVQYDKRVSVEED